MDVIAWGGPAGGRVGIEILFGHGGSAQARVEREAARDGPVEDAESGAHDCLGRCHPPEAASNVDILVRRPEGPASSDEALPQWSRGGCNALNRARAALESTCRQLPRSTLCASTRWRLARPG